MMVIKSINSAHSFCLIKEAFEPVSGNCRPVLEFFFFFWGNSILVRTLAGVASIFWSSGIVCWYKMANCDPTKTSIPKLTNNVSIWRCRS